MNELVVTLATLRRIGGGEIGRSVAFRFAVDVEEDIVMMQNRRTAVLV